MVLFVGRRRPAGPARAAASRPCAAWAPPPPAQPLPLNACVSPAPLSLTDSLAAADRAPHGPRRPLHPPIAASGHTGIGLNRTEYGKRRSEVERDRDAVAVVPRAASLGAIGDIVGRRRCQPSRRRPTARCRPSGGRSRSRSSNTCPGWLRRRKRSRCSQPKPTWFARGAVASGGWNDARVKRPSGWRRSSPRTPPSWQADSGSPRYACCLAHTVRGYDAKDGDRRAAIGAAP